MEHRPEMGTEKFFYSRTEDGMLNIEDPDAMRLSFRARAFHNILQSESNSYLLQDITAPVLGIVVGETPATPFLCSISAVCQELRLLFAERVRNNILLRNNSYLGSTFPYDLGDRGIVCVKDILDEELQGCHR